MKDSPTTGNNEQELISAVQQGDRFAFETLVEKYKMPVMNTAYRLTGDPLAAEDISQEVFFRIYKNMKHFNPRAGFKTYLFRSVRNACIDYLRQKRPVLSIDDPDHKIEIPDERVDISQQTEHLEKRDAFQALIKNLPEKQRTALILKVYQEMDYKKIGRVMNISISSVKSLLFRARMSLKKLNS